MHWDYITQASLAVQIHLVTALLALVLGCVMWFRPKGTRSHKMIGRGFVMFMLVTAITAIFIRSLKSGNFSLIHIFVPITLIGSYYMTVAATLNAPYTSYKFEAPLGASFGERDAQYHAWRGAGPNRETL